MRMRQNFNLYQLIFWEAVLIIQNVCPCLKGPPIVVLSKYQNQIRMTPFLKGRMFLFTSIIHLEVGIYEGKIWWLKDFLLPKEINVYAHYFGFLYILKNHKTGHFNPTLCNSAFTKTLSNMRHWHLRILNIVSCSDASDQFLEEQPLKSNTNFYKI